MKHQVNQAQAGKHLTEGESITVQEMADSMGDRLRDLVVKEKEKKQKEKDLRSLEVEKEGLRRQLERRLEDEESFGKKIKRIMNI